MIISVTPTPKANAGDRGAARGGGDVVERLPEVLLHRDRRDRGEQLPVARGHLCRIGAVHDVGVDHVARRPLGDLSRQLRGVSAAGHVLVDAADAVSVPPLRRVLPGVLPRVLPCADVQPFADDDTVLVGVEHRERDLAGLRRCAVDEVHGVAGLVADLDPQALHAFASVDLEQRLRA